MKSKEAQEAEFKAILDKYPQKSQILYSEILSTYSKQSLHQSKTAMRGKILDMVKDMVKEASK